jgi:hypothetical protein
LSINQVWRVLRPRFWRDPVSYRRIMDPVGFLLTFLAVVVGLVFFRAHSVASALSVLRAMAGMNGILHPAVQIVIEKGVTLPWSIFKTLQPLTPFLWIAVLFPSVTLLPNSLQLLQRFEPALDFPRESLGWGLGLRTVLRLNRITALLIAAMFTAGVMALTRTAGFIYGQF